MNQQNGTISHEWSERIREFEQIGRRAVAKAQAELRAKGIPVVHLINNQVYYELPSGEMTREVPELFRQNPLKASSDQ